MFRIKFKEWGENEEMQVLAKMFKVWIMVFNTDSMAWELFISTKGKCIDSVDELVRIRQKESFSDPRNSPQINNTVYLIRDRVDDEVRGKRKGAKHFEALVLKEFLLEKCMHLKDETDNGDFYKLYA